MGNEVLTNLQGSLRESFEADGFYLQDAVFDAEMVARLKAALHAAIAREAGFRRAGQDDASQVVCCPWHDDIFLRALKGAVFDGVDALMDDDCIIYNFGNSCMPPGQGNFSSNIHVERDYVTGRRTEGVGVIILLDDFTAENGATWFLPGSQYDEARPDPDHFFRHARRLVARAGSVFFFHPHIWHSGGVNRTAFSREALTVGFCRAYYKQRLDLPALFAGREAVLADAQIRQKLGFLAQPPRSLEEFYGRKGGWGG